MVLDSHFGSETFGFERHYIGAECKAYQQWILAGYWSVGECLHLHSTASIRQQQLGGGGGGKGEVARLKSQLVTLVFLCPAGGVECMVAIVQLKILAMVPRAPKGTFQDSCKYPCTACAPGAQRPVQAGFAAVVCMRQSVCRITTTASFCIRPIYSIC